MNNSLQKFIDSIEIAIIELSDMLQFPKEKLMEAREKQYEVLHKLAELEIVWAMYMDSECVYKLYSYLDYDETNVIYYNQEGDRKMCTTEEMKNVSYPEGEYQIIMGCYGATVQGHNIRIAADYFVESSINDWLNILSRTLYIMKNKKQVN